MKSILNEISVLRGAKPLTLDTTNKNRYRVEAIENDGSQTSYFFTTPIYNEETRKGVDMNFHAYNDSFVCLGSNAKITANKSLRMENQAGCCEIVLPDRPTMNAEGSLFCEGLTLSPTTNGIAIKSDFKKQKELILILEVDNPSLGIRANGRYFALMREKFRPFLIASCIGTTDEGGAIIAPAALNYQKISETRFLLSVLPTTLDGVSVQLEINLYEPKLFQDTTVESNSPNTNNVFGTIGFLGTTPEFGEQWLYTKPDYSKFPEIEERVIRSAVLHIPTYGGGVSEIRAYGVAFRFCSFGSTWNRKVPEAQKFSSSKHCTDYFSVDLTPIFCNSHGRLLKNNGLILRTIQGTHGFTAIATSDSCLQPQILEINYI